MKASASFSPVSAPPLSLKIHAPACSGGVHGQGAKETLCSILMSLCQFKCRAISQHTASIFVKVGPIVRSLNNKSDFLVIEVEHVLMHVTNEGLLAGRRDDDPRIGVGGGVNPQLLTACFIVDALQECEEILVTALSSNPCF